MSELDTEEQEILDAFERGELQRVKDVRRVLDEHREAAKWCLLNGATRSAARDEPK